MKKPSRIWTSNLPSRQQFPHNPSFGCCLVIQTELWWSTDGQKAHRALLLKASGYEPPRPGTHQVSFTCSSGTVEALALVISKRPPQWATGHWENSARTRSRPRLRLPVSHSPPARTSPEWIWIFRKDFLSV